MKRWIKRGLAIVSLAGLLVGGLLLFYNPASAAVPFGRVVSVGCDTERGVQVYVSNNNEDLAIVANGCTGPDLQSNVRVRHDTAHGVYVYFLHALSPVHGHVNDIAVVSDAVWAQA